ncbi:alpha-L-fucosidase [Cytophagaceae bacterium YF14B1]|uniref:alpha-L-fucosidase n=1 Tax=Xanthocytophaga flava TaxID=3048013 RepID=A0AAE3QSX0_9BACT|nr:alpha-L-fucosidase [Xanthocytophaga flavus]MDJ1484842.1 alpha-L-fucosidase [Xanthocytophaga flavus]
MKKLLLFLFILLCAVPFSSQAQKKSKTTQTTSTGKYQANWASIDSRPIPTWFEDAKFGIFIHWGLFSVPSWGPTPKDGASIYDCYSEWYWYRLTDPNSKVNPLFVKYHTSTYGKDFQYQDFVKDFKAEFFKPDDWASVIQDAGAKYVVLTSKHHEGFTLWPSAQAWNWNAVDVGPHRDLAGDLIKSVKSKGLRMGYYYSLYEWFNPLYKADVNRYVDEHMLPQLKDLVTRYNPDIVWTDGEWDHPSETWKSTEFLAWLYNDSPVKNDVVVNDRWGKETRSKHGGIYTTEYDLVHEKAQTEGSLPRYWEECRGIGSSFGYNRNENLEDYSSAEQLVHILIDKVSRGGNLLLNIGPTADGRIPVIMQQRLKEMGQWLKVNGDAIYGTRMWKAAPAKKIPDVFFTAKGKDVYVICTKWPENGIELEGVALPSKITMLGYTGPVKAAFQNNKLMLTPPVVSPATVPCNYAWTFKLENAVK